MTKKLSVLSQYFHCNPPPPLPSGNQWSYTALVTFTPKCTTSEKKIPGPNSWPSATRLSAPYWNPSKWNPWLWPWWRQYSQLCEGSKRGAPYCHIFARPVPQLIEHMPQSVRAPCATRCDLWPRHDLWPSDPGVTSTAGGHWPTATLTADDLPWRWLAAICDGSRSLNTPNDRSWRQRPLYLNVLTRFHITGDVRTPHIAKKLAKTRTWPNELSNDIIVTSPAQHSAPHAFPLYI